MGEAPSSHMGSYVTLAKGNVYSTFRQEWVRQRVLFMYTISQLPSVPNISYGKVASFWRGLF